MISKRDIPWLAGISLVLIGLLYAFFGDAVIHPGEYLFGVGGDGLKAYATLSWQLIHGGGNWHDLYMYPHGTHVMLTDANPFLVGLLSLGKWIGLTYTPENIVTIINSLLFLGMFPAVWLSYLIGKKLGFTSWYAAIIALLCLGLSPQIYRLTGHFSLAQFWGVPLLWWILLRWKEQVYSWKRLGLYLLSATWLAFIHPYLGMMSGGFLIAFLLVAWKRDNSFREIGFSSKILFLFIAFLPILILTTWQTLTTPEAIDAVKYPFGFRFYRAGFESIFIANDGPVRAFIDEFLRIRHYNMEGFAYVGMTGFLLLIFLGISFIIRRIKPESSLISYWKLAPAALQHSLLAGILILIPAMVIPINWIPFLEDFLGPLRQFRSPGRLAWIFYHIYFLFAAWLLYAIAERFRKSAGRQRLAVLVLLGGCGVWAIEGGMLLNSAATTILGQAKKDVPEWNIEWQTELDHLSIDKESHQAIITLPLFMHGSEKIYRGNWYTERYGHLLAIRSGIPMVNNFAARASLHQTEEALQLISYPLIDRKYPRQIPDKRPFLILHHPESGLLPGEQWVLSQSEKLGRIGEIEMYEISPENLTKDKSLLHEILQIPDSVAGLSFVEEGFGDSITGKTGTSARSCTRWDQTIWQGELSIPDTEELVELSIWIEIDRESDYLPDLKVKQFDGETLVSQQKMVTQATPDVWNGWAIARDTISLRSYRTVIESNTKSVTYDRLMIRSLDSIVVSRHLTTQIPILWNNYPLEPTP